jgi:hypothetical protein
LFTFPPKKVTKKSHGKHHALYPWNTIRKADGEVLRCPTCSGGYKRKLKEGYRCRHCETIYNAEGEKLRGEAKPVSKGEKAAPRTIGRGYAGWGQW